MAKKNSKQTTTISGSHEPPTIPALSDEVYEAELLRLQVEFTKLQEWVKATGAKVVVVFEGRDAAGKGGTIARITQYTSPRIVRIAALPAPSEREKSQWYFQRYVSHLPAAGEIVLFDRSWYTRAGVEKVMGFATGDEVELFLEQCPGFENMLIDSGIILIKYWFTVSEAEQERRFQSRLKNPLKRWKLSPMDLQARSLWVEYSKAKDEMFARTDTVRSPWIEVPSDSKKHARINCLTHLLAMIPYSDVMHPPIELTPRPESNYERPPMDLYTFVPDAVQALVNKAPQQP